MTLDRYTSYLDKYKDYVSCVLFMGGEWTDELPLYLDIAREYGFKTALYTGDIDVADHIKERLTFLKTGDYREDLGALDSETTNQTLVNLVTGEVLNHFFLEHKK